MVNSLEHLVYFLLVFITVPILVFNLFYWLFKKLKLKKHSMLALAILNVFTFLFLIKTITYSGAQRKKTVLVIIIAILFAIFLKKYLKKLVLLQYLLALVGFISLIVIIYTNQNISNEWQEQPDAIRDIEFKKKPNVYVIQPDGYTNFSELNKGYYNYDNSNFESFLNQSNFTQYPNFRSNYSTTLSSNSSFFMMKHHYYNNRISDFELYNARDIIISKNPVLDIFKANSYKTYFITETGYMLFNRPKMGYDYCNFDYGEISFVSPGISDPIDVSLDLTSAISEISEQPKFFFIQLLKPWHIKSRKTKLGNNKVIEREQWLSKLEAVNNMLKGTIEIIKQQDSNALIVIMADHGGYVGMNYTDESDTLIKDRDLIYSIFSSQLSIHWPQNSRPKFDDKFKSSVNVFRLLFAYLSEDEKHLNQLQPDVSYKVLREGVLQGIYEYIDEDGNIKLKERK